MRSCIACSSMPEGGLESRLTAVWYRTAPPPLFLRGLSAAYAGALAVRGALYATGLRRVHRMPVPVVVIGNISVGGTGKTPLTAFLVERLRARGRRPGIASRGYGGRGGAPRLVAPDDDPAEVGDEPLLLNRQTGAPVCVSGERAAAARRLVEAGCDLVLCDDGLQHRALGRDLELAVVDGARGLGNGWLLPAGPLRENAGRLAAVDAVVMNGDGPAPATAARVLRMSLEPGPLRALRGDAREPLEWLQGRRIHAVTGIGNPGRFFEQLRALGAEVLAHPFPDHHAFTAADVAFGDELPVIMTTKDAVKCERLADARHWCLPVTARLSADDERWLVERILALPPSPRRSPA